MASFCAQVLAAELKNLIQVLRKEKHPALARVEPYYSERSFEEIKNAWMTLNCIMAEMRGMHASIQNLTHLIVSQTQQLAHPMGCRHFSLHTAPFNVESFQGLEVIEPQTDLLSAKPQPKKKIKRLRKSSKQTATLLTKEQILPAVTQEMIDEALKNLSKPSEKATLISEEGTPLNEDLVNEVLAGSIYSPLSLASPNPDHYF